MTEWIKSEGEMKENIEDCKRKWWLSWKIQTGDKQKISATKKNEN